MGSVEDDGRRYVEYANVPGYLGALISARMATLLELQTVYSVEDAWDLLEVLVVDRENRRIANAKL
jgi:hypothetical protein